VAATCSVCHGTGEALDDAEIRRRAACYPALLAACERLVFADELGAVYERHFAMEQAKAAIRAAKPPDKEPT